MYDSPILSSDYDITDNIEAASSEDSELVANPIDMREELFVGSTLRNDIEVFKFKADSKNFGTRNAEIQSVKILNKKRQPYEWLVGGNDVILEIKSIAYEHISRPIVGFEMKDRLGQVVFADNTYLIYENTPVPVLKGQNITASFAFKMPILPAGDYSFSAALADGTQESHIQHHWIFDALVIKVHASQICHGLIGVPMSKIDLLIT